MRGDDKIRAHCYVKAIIHDPSGYTWAWYKSFGLYLSEKKENSIFYLFATIYNMVLDNIRSSKDKIKIDEFEFKENVKDEDNLIFENKEDFFHEMENHKRMFTPVLYDHIEDIVDDMYNFEKSEDRKIFIDVVTFLHTMRKMKVEEAIRYAQGITEDEYAELVKLVSSEEKKEKTILERVKTMTSEEIARLTEEEKAEIRKQLKTQGKKTKSNKTTKKTVSNLRAYELSKGISPVTKFTATEKESKHVKKKRKLSITFRNINKANVRRKWKHAIEMAINSMPEEERIIIPDITVYPSLISSIVDNFDVNSSETDRIASFMYKNGAWAYSRLQNDDMFISLSIKRFRKLNEFVPPEFTIFHEFGHYQIAKRFNEHICDVGFANVELKADRYGIFALARMLHYHPNYETISENTNQKVFMDIIKGILKSNVRESMSTKEKNKQLSIIVSEIFKLFEWENIYNNLER
jgi:hypothetical protein